MPIEAPGPELTVPGIEQVVRVEVRRYVVVHANFLHCSRLDDMTTRVSQENGLVAGAVTRVGAEGDSMFSCASVVAFDILCSDVDLPLISKCVDMSIPMALRFNCLLVQMALHLFRPWLVH